MQSRVATTRCPRFLLVLVLVLVLVLLLVLVLVLVLVLEPCSCSCSNRNVHLPWPDQSHQSPVYPSVATRRHAKASDANPRSPRRTNTQSRNATAGVNLQIDARANEFPLKIDLRHSMIDGWPRFLPAANPGTHWRGWCLERRSQCRAKAPTGTAERLVWKQHIRCRQNQQVRGHQGSGAEALT